MQYFKTNYANRNKNHEILSIGSRTLGVTLGELPSEAKFEALVNSNRYKIGLVIEKLYLSQNKLNTIKNSEILRKYLNNLF